MSKLSSKYISVRDQEPYIYSLVQKNKFAIFGKIIDSIFFPEDDIFNEHVKVRYAKMRLKML